ncbi:MAG: Biotin--[acetyl-CoA-carboxylase] ligase [Dehalococcoidales bacterium]|nr:Biotin--[acetyl-CoA-carboxylase] ligase [Dehalococcoidales bacterium]
MVADNLSAAEITEGLATRFAGQRVLYYPRLTSTMDIARQEAQKKAAEGTIVIADEQTAARGRLKRVWISPGGNIAFSIILYPGIAHLPYLIMLASLAVVHSIESVTGLKAQIKWPNDVLINGRKVCGILIESDVRSNVVHYTIIGIGINVNLSLADFPEIRSIATSLADEAGRDVSRLSLIRHLLVEIESRYLALLQGKPPYEEWRDSLITLGKRVRVKTGEMACEGFAESVAGDGSLLLRLPDGSLTRIIAGDVTLRD